MNLIYYCSNSNQYGLGLYKQIKVVLRSEKIAKCSTFSGLKKTLLNPQYDVFAAVLVITDQEDLIKIHSVRELLDSIRLIMVIPDFNPESIFKVHRLRPRFITLPGNNSNDVIAVLNNMLESEKKRNNTNDYTKNGRLAAKDCPIHKRNGNEIRR